MEALKDRNDIKSLIKSVSEEHGIKNHVITNVQTNQKGEGYLGQIFLVTVNDSSNGKKLELVIKAAFIDEKVRQLAPIRSSFENEIYFYTHIYPAFEEFENERGIAESVEYVPTCFKVCVKNNEEMLALENLKSAGFECFDKTLSLDEDHVKMIFKIYGRFHGYSFALRDQNPEKYDRISQGMVNIYDEFLKNPMFADNFVEIGKLVQGLLIPGEDDEIIRNYEKYEGKNIVDIFRDLVIEDVGHSAILHGDCWSNNMMFKYEDTDDGKKLKDMRLIDWQLIKTGSPVCDLSYCFYSGGSKKVFDNLNEYLQIYYDSFSSFVRELGSDPEKLFPFSVLKEHWKKYSRFGMIMAFAILKMKLTNKEDLLDLTDDFDKDNIAEAFMKMKFDEDGYSKRIRGLLWHMSEVDAL